MKQLRIEATWLLISTLFAAALQVIQLGVLARKLANPELGMLAIINAIVAIVTVLQDMGMSSYLVHRQQISRREQSTIYWVNVALGGVAGCVLALLAWPLAYFYRLPALTGLILLASLNFLLLGHLSQYQAHYIKAKRLVRLVKIEMVSKLVAFICVLALLYFTSLTVAAAILGLIINAALRVFLLVCCGEKRWLPTWEWDNAVMHNALRYGLFQLGSQILNQLRSQADTLIVGKCLGSDLLGTYSLAKDLISQPLRLITPMLNRLALPRFAEVQQHLDDMAQRFLRATQSIIFMSSVLFALITLFSPTLVYLLYGAGREAVQQLIPLMVLFGALRPMGGLTGALCQASGRTRIEFQWNVVAGVITLPLLMTIQYYPRIGYVALLLSLLQILLSVLIYPFFVRPTMGVTLSAYLRSWLPIALLFAIIVFLMHHFQLYIFVNWITHWL